MSDIERTASRVNLVTSLIERGGKLANDFGWEVTPARIVNAVWPAAILVGAMIWQYVPWYVIVPTAIFAVGSLLQLYVAFARARAVVGVKRLSLTDAAALCERAERGFYDFVESRAEEIGTLHRRAINYDDPNIGRLREDQKIAEELFLRKLRARIGGDVGAAVGALTSLGIKAESDLRSLHWADSGARFFGAQARLLRGGHLEEAQKLGQRDLFF